MNTKIMILVSLIVLLISSCAYNEGIIQKDNTAYLKLTGNTDNISMQIDDGEINQLIEISDNTIYEIQPGTHIITVRRNSEIIVKRKLYFDNQITTEVNVK